MAMPTRPSRIRVLLVDDHPAIIEALESVICSAADMELFGRATTADEAFAALSTDQPEVVVADLTLPDAHGLDFIQSLLSIHTELAVVVYTVHDEIVYAERAIRLGVMGFVMKREPSRVVREAIRSAARGEIYLSRSIGSRVLSKAAGRPQRGPEDRISALTDREVDVVHLLGLGYGVGEIADRLHITPKTVETHRRHAKEKLSFRSVSELLVYAVRWVDGQPPPTVPRETDP